jgi:hypothetical protein
MPKVYGVAVVVAVTVVTAGCAPTGNLVGDLVATGFFAAGVAWLAASAAWWSLVIAGAVTMLASGGGWGAAFGALGAALGLWIGDRRLSSPWLRSLAAGLIVHGVLRLGAGPFFGASGLAATVIVLFVGVISFRRRPRAQRRRFLHVGLIGTMIVPLAGGGLVVGALRARDDIERGYRDLLAGLEYLEQGDASASSAAFRSAAAALSRADGDLSSPLVLPARLVPIVAQHRGAATSVVASASDAARAVADALQVVDFDALSLEGGRVDLEQLELLAGPLGRLHRAVAELEAALVASDSPWLLESVSQRLQQYLDRVSAASRQSMILQLASERGPAMLGADRPRTYFVGFATTAEARSLIGVMGNFALLRITDGQLDVTEFGRINDLRNETVAKGDVVLDAPEEFFARYRAYGAGDGTPAFPASPSFWSNVLMTPDMPTAGPLISQLWVASGRAPVDGVLVLGPEALAGLLRATGPITVDGLAAPLTADSVEQFLLRDQYQLDTPERRDLLEDVAEATLGALLSRRLPPAQSLAQALGPAAVGGQLLMWSADPADAELLHLMGIDGALVSPDGRDGIAVVTNNGTANKIDSFLQRSVTYRARYDRTSGQVLGTIEIVLRNTAPSTGFPDYVIGTEFFDLPPGTNRTLLSVYTAFAVQSAAIDGRPLPYNGSSELGWNVASTSIDLGPGEKVTVTLTVAGIAAPDQVPGTYELVYRPQAMAFDDVVSIEVLGDTEVRYDGGSNRTVILEGFDS